MVIAVEIVQVFALLMFFGMSIYFAYKMNESNKFSDELLKK